MLTDQQQWLNFWNDSLQQQMSRIASFSKPWQSNNWMNASNQSVNSDWFQSLLSQPYEFLQQATPFSDQSGFEFSKLFSNPLLQDLKQAVYNEDLDRQIDILKNLSSFWFQQTSLFYTKNLDMLKWQQESVDLMLKRNEFEHFENTVTRQIRLYFVAFNELYGSIIRLRQAFDGLDENVSQQFVDTVMQADFSINDAMQLFDAWSHEFEKTYKQITLSDSYQSAFSCFVESIAKVKQISQELIDQQVEQFGLPSNREMKAVHQKIHQLQKSVRHLNSLDANRPDLQQAIEQMQVELEAKLNKQNQQKDEQINRLEKQVTDLIKTITAQQVILQKTLTPAKPVNAKQPVAKSAAAKKAPASRATKK